MHIHTHMHMHAHAHARKHTHTRTLCGHTHQFLELCDKGLLNIKLLAVLWKDYKTHTQDLIGLMCKYGLFVPLQMDAPGQTGSAGGQKGGRSRGHTGMTPRSVPLNQTKLFLIPALLPLAPLDLAWSDLGPENLHTSYECSAQKYKTTTPDFANRKIVNSFNVNEMFRHTGSTPLPKTTTDVFSLGGILSK